MREEIFKEDDCNGKEKREEIEVHIIQQSKTQIKGYFH